MNRDSEISKNYNNNMQKQFNVFVDLGDLSYVNKRDLDYAKEVLQLIYNNATRRGDDFSIVLNNKGQIGLFKGFPTKVWSSKGSINMYIFNFYNLRQSLTDSAPTFIKYARQCEVPILVDFTDLHWFVQNSGVVDPQWNNVWIVEQVGWLICKAKQVLNHRLDMVALQGVRPCLIKTET